MQQETKGQMSGTREKRKRLGEAPVSRETHVAPGIGVI